MRIRPFIVIVTVAVVLSGASLGYAVGRVLGVRHYVPPAPSAAGAAMASDAVPSGEPVPPFEGWTNVFDPSRGMVRAVVAVAATDNAKAPPPAFILVGTVTSNDPSARRALLWGEGWKEPRAIREGQDAAPGTRVASVDRTGAWIVRGKARERLDLLPVGSRSRPPVSAAPPSAPLTVPVPGARPAAPPIPGAGPELRVERLSPTAFALDEAGVNQLSGNFNQFMTQVRLVPFFDGNRPAGYRIAGIRPGTTFERLGFLSGDVIQTVNQVDLNSPEKLYTIFQNLKDERKVGVNVLRGGQKTTLTYEIR
jgi:type II secretion system protein C